MFHRYTERLGGAGIALEPSGESRSDSDDNALAETIKGFYKGELIRAVRLEKRGWPSNWLRSKRELVQSPPLARTHRLYPIDRS